MDASTFNVVDYIVFSLMILSSLAIGIYSAFTTRKQKTTEDYLLGNRQLSLGPVALSICVSLISSNTLVGTPAEVYGYGIGIAIVNLGGSLAGVVIAFTLVEVIYPLGIISIHQYLEMRFKSATLKWYGAVIQITVQMLYVGTVLFGPATSLEVSTGIPTWVSLITVAIIGIFYTTIGGMKAVVWTDTFQSMVMILGNIVLIIIGCVKVGGVSNVLQINQKWGRFDVSLSLDPTVRLTLWYSLLGGLLFFMSTIGSNQPCLQRTCTLKNITLAKWSAALGSIFMALFTLMSAAVGLVLFAYYTSLGCDPVQSEMISNGNQILPYYIMDVLAYPGLPGMLFASLFSASLSSLSSSINSMSAVMWQDVLEPYLKHWTEQRKTYCNKCLTVFFGLCCLATSFVMLYVQGSLVAIALSVLGAVLGPLLGVFFLGIFIPFCNWKGALLGGIVSVSVNLWILFGSVITGSQAVRLPAPTYKCEDEVFNTTLIYNYNVTEFSFYTSSPNNITFPDISNQEDVEGFLDWLYSISYILYAAIGIFITMTIGILVSLCTGYTKMKDVEPHLLHRCVCCGPEEKEATYRAIEITDFIDAELELSRKKQVHDYIE